MAANTNIDSTSPLGFGLLATYCTAVLPFPDGFGGSTLRAVTTVRILETKLDETGKELISPLEDIFVQAACGEKMAVDWAAYRAESDLPDPLDMLKTGYKPDMIRMDRTMASLGGMVAYVIGRTSKEERHELAGPAWEILLRCVEGGVSDLLNLCGELFDFG